MATSMTTYSNNTISQVEINGTTYDITDATTRSTVSQLDSRVTALESSVANGVKVNQSTHYHSSLYSGTGNSAYHLDCQGDGNIVRYKNDGTGTIGLLDGIKNITRSGTTFTATKLNGGTFTFTQQDNNTTYGVATTSANGLLSSGDKTKLNKFDVGTYYNNDNAFGVELWFNFPNNYKAIIGFYKEHVSITVKNAKGTNIYSKTYV